MMMPFGPRPRRPVMAKAKGVKAPGPRTVATKPRPRAKFQRLRLRRVRT
jgi:hypothetical protein